MTGYDASEVRLDIEKGDLAQPAAIANYSGIQTLSAVEVEAGQSVFGAESSVEVERAMEYHRDGTSVDRYTMTGTSGSELGVHLDAGIAANVDNSFPDRGDRLSARRRLVHGPDCAVPHDQVRDLIAYLMQASARD